MLILYNLTEILTYILWPREATIFPSLTRNFTYILYSFKTESQLFFYINYDDFTEAKKSIYSKLIMF